MSILPAGSTVAYTITFLEMATRPGFDLPDLPADLRLERAENPPVWFFLSMYDAVGRDYEWRDRFEQEQDDPDALRGFVEHPEIGMWVAYRNGWPLGFFMLDWSQPGICDLAYFGMVPQAVGGGIGGKLLKTAILTGWARPGTQKMTVNTCTLDHPRALNLYKKMGFSPVRTEDHKRILFRDRDTSKHPV